MCRLGNQSGRVQSRVLSEQDRDQAKESRCYELAKAGAEMRKENLILQVLLVCFVYFTLYYFFLCLSVYK
jgi:hypothetical protein